ncbi:unnamed protein product [Spirodela intermedia]|uniref:Uncharacterized protein n=1 Tax=Spirodela intermedia TaxID=51605 RepID=A0A7I8JBB2_SPIIN|nr:unnamed protein product [Spirodela intermedia]CAA6667496.1 unnamed protein product [Spirodela intermedia]
MAAGIANRRAAALLQRLLPSAAGRSFSASSGTRFPRRTMADTPPSAAATTSSSQVRRQNQTTFSSI